MTEILRPLDLVPSEFDFANSGIQMNSMERAERAQVSDSKNGSATWQNWNNCNFNLNVPKIVSPDWHQLQLQILGSAITANGTYALYGNEVIAIEAGSPVYSQAKCSMGNQVRDFDSLAHKTNLVKRLVYYELGYGLAQSQADGFFVLDKQGCPGMDNSFFSTNPATSLMYYSGTYNGDPTINSASLLFPAVWNLANVTGGVLGNASILTPAFVASTTGNYAINSVLPNRFYNSGFKRRVGLTNAYDIVDSTIQLRMSIKHTFPSWRDIPVVANCPVNFNMILNPQPGWITTLPNCPTPQVTIKSSTLWYSIYQPKPSVDLALHNFLNSGKQYERIYNTWDAVQTSVNGGNSITLTSLKGNAQRIFVYFQTASRDNNYTCLKSYFENYQPSLLYLNVAGQSVPQNPYAPLNASDQMRPYLDYIKGTSGYDTAGTAGQQLSYGEWYNYYPLVCFEIPQTQGFSTAGQPIQLFVNFPTPGNLPALNVVAVIEYQRKVIVQYINGGEIWGQPI